MDDFLRISVAPYILSEKKESKTGSVPKNRSHIQSFIPVWAFGVDLLTKFINITKDKNMYKIYYTVSQIGIIYTHNTNDMLFLMGHQNLISCIAADPSGTWLVSGDVEIDNTIIIWRSEDGFPVRTIFDPHPVVGVHEVAISTDSKIVVSIGKECDPVIKLWLWTFGRDEPDAIYTAKHIYGEVKHIIFNPNDPTTFAVTFSEVLIFFTWDTKQLTSSLPSIPKKRSLNYGAYTCSTYIPNSHECLTATSLGWIIIWGLSFYTVPYESIAPSNNKFFVGAIRLQKDGISRITFVDGFIVTVDYKGILKFYDEKLKILYFYQRNFLPSILVCDFNVQPRKYIAADPTVLTDRSDTTLPNTENVVVEQDSKTDQAECFKEYTESEKELKVLNTNDPDIAQETQQINSDQTSLENEGCEETYCKTEDRSDEYEKIYLNLLLSDFTLQRAPFLLRDYILLTVKGQFAYVDVVNNKLDFFLSSNYSPLTAVDVHTEKPLVILGYANGFLYVYNYENYSLISRRQVLNFKEEMYNEITRIKYSNLGLFLACGTAGGHLFFVDPVTIQPVYKKPFIYEHYKIIDIKFSVDSHYLAYYDVSNAVCLLKQNYTENSGNPPEWIFYGRVMAHGKDIVGMVFCANYRLFTVSKDKYLVEYYVKDSQPGKLEVICKMPILQRGYPISFTSYSTYNETTMEIVVYLLISTNDFKYIIINEQKSTIERTILSPFFGKPVKQLKIIPNKSTNYLMFSTGKYIGMQMFPLSGNPYKQVGCIAHSSYIEKFKISQCGNFVFTFGQNDNVCLMWSIQTEALKVMIEKGGTELCPYYSLIEDGSDGWLFREMKDLFYYVQILHQGEDSPLPRNISDKIPTSEIPNLMRAIGFFPTEFELDNILYEVKFHYLNQEEEEDEINFENFVKLYINHRHVQGFNKNEIKWAFNILGENSKIRRENFVSLLCTQGECFSYLSLEHCLSILTHQHRDEQDIPRYQFSEMLPEELTYEFFMSNILGVKNKDI